jgi:predicted glutamine amidotransferase
MGRLAAYLGPATKIAQVIEVGSTSLSLQSAAFPDGFGVAWYPLGDDDESPIVMRHLQPLATQGHLLEPARRYPAECVIASIGRAPIPPAEISACQPFRFENLLFAHDGEIQRFDEVYARALRERLSDLAYPLVRSHDPSELLFATWLDALGVQRGPDAMATALEQMVSSIQELAQRYDAPASFGCVVSDGTCLITLRTATHGSPPPLYTIVAGEEAPVPASGRVVASEPLFNGSWTALDPHSLVIFTVEPTDDRAGVSS